MGVLVKEVLRRLCAEFGWSYAVFWKAIGCGDQIFSRNLAWEDGHCERFSASQAASGFEAMDLLIKESCERFSASQAASGFEAMDLLIKESGVLRNSQNGGFSQLKCQTEDRVHTLVFKLMATNVHVVGDGIVGKAALTGNHEWMLGDVLTDNGSISKGLTEISDQVLAGIKTLAIIPVLPHGVVQLGSTKMVIENFGFINHVKGLFGQLQFVPGALLSNVTQKKLHQKIRLHESIGMQAAAKQFGEVATGINSLLSLNDDNGNCQRFRHLDSRTVTEPCPSSAQLYDQMLARTASVSEIPLAKENVTHTMISHSSQPMVCSAINPILHLNSQLESGHQEAHLRFSNPDVRLPNKSISQGRYEHPTSLPYSRLTFLEEQLLSMSGIRRGEFNNNCESTLDNTNMRPLQSDGSTSLNPLQGSEIFSSFARSQLSDGASDICKFTSFPSCTENLRKQCADSSSTEVAQVFSGTDHSTFNGMLEVSHLNSIDKTSHSGSSAEKQKSNNRQFQALESQSTQFDDRDSSNCSLLGNRPEDPVQGNRMHRYSSRDENCRAPVPSRDDNKGNVKAEFLQSLDVKVALCSLQSSSENDLFDVLRFDEYKSGFTHGNFDNVKTYGTTNAYELSTDVSTCITELEEGFVYNALDDVLCCKGMFSEAGSDQLLDAVVSQFNSGVKYVVDDNASCKTSLKKISSSSIHTNTPTNGRVVPTKQMHAKSFGLPSVRIKSEPEPSSSMKSSCSIERGEGCIPQSSGGYNSQINLWIEGQKMNRDSHSVVHGKRVDEVGKQNKKRSRPGENPRPRPKDRQMIQDRVQELREIVPNGAKCSIDALLEKTIKHMLFLQSVTKHADKLKETGESKILSMEGGLLLKDNFDGGATWAFEVGSQSMICPIIVEDLNPPRQMLVEILCEERGLFLEIADLVRGLGLTILKGVMEARNDKVWARFAVEANRDVTRMEIFLSLVRLLEPSAGSSIAPEGVDNVSTPHMFLSPSSIPATGLSDLVW